MAKINALSTQQDRAIDIGELKIIMRPWNMPICHYIGTRMQLESEGLIPEGTIWPDGYARLYWLRDGVSYMLERERPEGAKGPRRMFIDIDHWCLRSEVRDRFNANKVEQKTRELAELLRVQTPEEEAEWQRRYRRWYAAKNDERFQEFKALFPAIELANGRRRGRKPSAKGTGRE